MPVDEAHRERPDEPADRIDRTSRQVRPPLLGEREDPFLLGTGGEVIANVAPHEIFHRRHVAEEPGDSGHHVGREPPPSASRVDERGATHAELPRQLGLAPPAPGGEAVDLGDEVWGAVHREEGGKRDVPRHPAHGSALPSRAARGVATVRPADIGAACGGMPIGWDTASLVRKGQRPAKRMLIYYLATKWPTCKGSCRTSRGVAPSRHPYHSRDLANAASGGGPPESLPERVQTRSLEVETGHAVSTPQSARAIGAPPDHDGADVARILSGQSSSNRFRTGAPLGRPQHYLSPRGRLGPAASRRRGRRRGPHT